MNCPNCGVPLMGGMSVCPKCKFDTKTSDGGAAFKEKRLQNERDRVEAERRLVAEEEARKKAAYIDSIRDRLQQEMLLTTCPSLEGYTIKKQCGLVFGEVYFKSGIISSIGASISNFVDALSFDDKELSGTTRLLSSAREHAIKTMKNAAIDKDANAIVGIDSESSIAGDVFHITIYGTAVVVESPNN